VWRRFNEQTGTALNRVRFCQLSGQKHKMLGFFGVPSVRDIVFLPRKLTEPLRLVTNAVKHGDGDSRTRLWRKFPRLFWPYNHDSYPIPEDVPTVPTAANTLELTPEHFREYAEAVEAFWKAVPSLDRA
jgi:hypothetical protein